MQDTRRTIVNVMPLTPSTMAMVTSVLPLSSQVVHVPVAKVSCSGNFTLRTNFSVINRSNNLGNSTDIHIVRLALHVATFLSGHNNGEDVRMILGGQMTGVQVGVISEDHNGILRENRIVVSGMVVRFKRVVVKSPLVVIIHRT